MTPGIDHDRTPLAVPGGGRQMKHRCTWALVALIFAASPIMAMAGPMDRLTTLPVDTVLRVRLDDTLGSDRSRPGDRFTATVEDPALPKGTIVRGVVIGATPADKDTPGRIGVDFQTLEMPDGR